MSTQHQMPVKEYKTLAALEKNVNNIKKIKNINVKGIELKSLWKFIMLEKRSFLTFGSPKGIMPPILLAFPFQGS